MSQYCTPTLINNTIANNRCTNTTSSTYGAGVFAYGTAAFSGLNNIIYFNQADTCANCAGTVDFNYTCCSQIVAGISNITDYPLFVEATNNNFTLEADSPCIDAGDPNSPPDPDRTIADMGALYFDQTVGVVQHSQVQPAGFLLFPAYPNPFNPTTEIGFLLPRVERVSLKVYDISGALVVTLVEGWQKTGRHEITFDAADLASGIYIYNLHAGSFYSSGKMILMK